LALNPDLAPACNNLAYLLLQKKKHVAEAFRLAQRAVAHAPGEGTFWDTLGWAYYHQGNLKAAVHNLQRAVEIKKDPIFLYHLAIVYRDQGKEEQAKEEARAALRISSHFPEVEKCRNLLRALEHPRSGR
jgi:tetratricopeptide (TPR) repeat protein